MESKKMAKVDGRQGSNRCAACPESSALLLSQNIMYCIICRLREANFQNPSLAEFGCDARSFSGDLKGCCVGGT